MESPSAVAPGYYDSHTHLLSILQKFELKPEAFPEFRKANFPDTYLGCVNVACEPETFRENLPFLQFDGVVGAFGVHPHQAKDYTPEIEAWLKETMQLPKVAAWGEIGLDYHYSFSEHGVQREVFTRQAKEAVALKKPIIVHSREAEEDTIKIM